MKAYEYILSKQVQWAMNSGIKLIGSKGKRGRPAYTPELKQNLFEPLEPDVRQSFEKGDGNEIIGSQDSQAKMQAVHSYKGEGIGMCMTPADNRLGFERHVLHVECREDSDQSAQKGLHACSIQIAAEI